MTPDTTDRQLVWIALAIIVVLFILPAFAMGFGMMGPTMGGDWGHPMWGAGDVVPGWMFVVWAVMQLLFLALLVGAGYLGYRALRSRSKSTDPALEELRSAYARGEIDDEEFERRRERLESDR
ncbi:SHOCT domain-containing protein [Halovivax limisalsi]|uniref:SHOCT domain-containing protein n=1 Tax=Halovivax limisalsi TaxID=1453760 RepID=UPI001FFD9492|nr:SHOCT domain-containing protein [Halovivax limisalsi]